MPNEIPKNNVCIFQIFTNIIGMFNVYKLSTFDNLHFRRLEHLLILYVVKVANLCKVNNLFQKFLIVFGISNILVISELGN